MAKVEKSRVLKYKALVMKYARYYARCKMLDIEDLMQEGYIGVMNALERYDASGLCEIKYVALWINGSMVRAINNMGGVVRIPQSVRVLTYRSNRVKQTDEENKNIHEILSAQYFGLDESVVGHNITSADSADNITLSNDLHDLIKSILDELNTRTAYIVRSLFGIDCPQKRIVDLSYELKISKNRIVEIRNLSLAKIRKKANTLNLQEYIDG